MKRKILGLIMCVILAATCVGCGTEKEEKVVDRDTLYQTATLQSLTLGNYEGSTTVGELKKVGDTGLGTFEGVNGELILLDGVVYQALGDGSIQVAKDDTKIPFSDVTFFDNDKEVSLSNVKNTEDMKQQLTSLVEKEGKNFFYMACINGTFSNMQVRSEKAQTKPYKPLDEVMKTDQTVFDNKNITGTVVALYCPDYMTGLNVGGWHFHFISEDKKKGGHILEMSGSSLTAGIDQTKAFQMQLPGSDTFQKQELATDLEKSIKKVETNGK